MEKKPGRRNTREQKRGKKIIPGVRNKFTAVGRKEKGERERKKPKKSVTGEDSEGCGENEPSK